MNVSLEQECSRFLSRKIIMKRQCTVLIGLSQAGFWRLDLLINQ